MGTGSRWVCRRNQATKYRFYKLIKGRTRTLLNSSPPINLRLIGGLQLNGILLPPNIKYMGLGKGLLRLLGQLVPHINCEGMEVVVWGEYLASNVGMGRFTQLVASMLSFPPYIYGILIGLTLSDGCLVEKDEKCLFTI
ncbi:hypothetical protein BC936DRAFT_140586 [Jimgerdemannia flammicorona]|uniref:Uncharacterized protein n=2 Tax=Jimgerdemannia flammicorona TaxID=994334 RepID=A0A433QXE0_9FUNG|nr:hypothetical protein BC936DRAFT_140586 [Jimgerdemannia flammicorona]RUS34415.1 hypothetical protein BC938DRAFT_480570 [Jimgerdemannia flammicorona]